MKVVVIKSPKFLSGILRMIFKINKDERITGSGGQNACPPLIQITERTERI